MLTISFKKTILAYNKKPTPRVTQTDINYEDITKVTNNTIQTHK